MEELLPNALRHPILFAVALFASLIVMLELGRFLARLRGADLDDGASDGLSLMDGAVFALLGLLVALTFSDAAGRLDHRRALIVDEANAIGTARLRVDLLPPDVQPSAQAAFDRYIRSRADAYARAGSLAEFRAALRRSEAIQREIWDLSVAAGRRADALPSANMLLLPALNEMIDITTTRAMALRTHTPLVIYLVLWLTACAAALLAGHNLAKADKGRLLHTLTFAVVVTIALFVLMDLEYPRVGLIRMDAFDALISSGAP